MKSLSRQLTGHVGRPYYAYLSPELKLKVNAILKTAVTTDKGLKQVFNAYMDTQKGFLSFYNHDPVKIESRLSDFEERFFSPRLKNDSRTLHNIIIRSALLYSQTAGDVRKNESVTASRGKNTSHLVYSVNHLLNQLGRALAADTRNNSIHAIGAQKKNLIQPARFKGRMLTQSSRRRQPQQQSEAISR